MYVVTFTLNHFKSTLSFNSMPSHTHVVLVQNTLYRELLHIKTRSDCFRYFFFFFLMELHRMYDGSALWTIFSQFWSKVEGESCQPRLKWPSCHNIHASFFFLEKHFTHHKEPGQRKPKWESKVQSPSLLAGKTDLPLLNRLL